MFLFDFDGVVIDNESTWEKIESSLYREIYGPEVAKCLGSTIGLSIDSIHEKAVRCGTRVMKEVLVNGYHAKAPDVYRSAPLTPGINTIGGTLKALGYRIGIVSASPRVWINMALARTPFKNDVETILSLYDRKDLAHKPAPDGYQEAMNTLGGSPENTVVLEDSNTGIEAAKSSGAHTIRFTQNLIEGYVQNEADSTADNLQAVVAILRSMQA